MYIPPLHAAHQVRETFDGLAFVSWLAIGLGIGALVLAWGRIFAWLRAPDASGPELVRWGEDGSELYFELRNTRETGWTLETDGAPVALEADLRRTLFLRGERPEATRPVALRSTGGVRLPL